MKWIRAGICMLAGFSVLAFGGVEPWGIGVLEFGAASLFLLWGALALRQRQVELHWNWLYPPVLALGGIACAQGALGVSAYGYATKVELLKWGASLLLFFLGVESFRSPKEVKMLARFLIGFGFVVSLFSIVHSFSSNGKLYWLVTPGQGGDPFGPYVNRDHFAGFAELIIPLGLGFLFFGAVRREKLVLLGLVVSVPIGALVLSASRGGMVSLLFEILLLAFLARNCKFGKQQLLGAALFALALCAMLAWLGIGAALERFEAPTAEHISQEGRVWMYRDTWQIFLHHPWIGTGLGTLQTVFPRYETHYQGGIVDHAHNDFLELLSDTGVAGGICGLSFVALLFWRGVRNLRLAESPWSRAVYAGAMAGCSGLLVHSLFDFNLHIPANALIFILLAVVASGDFSSENPGGMKRNNPRAAMKGSAPVRNRDAQTALQGGMKRGNPRTQTRVSVPQRAGEEFWRRDSIYPRAAAERPIGCSWSSGSAGS